MTIDDQAYAIRRRELLGFGAVLEREFEVRNPPLGSPYSVNVEGWVFSKGELLVTRGCAAINSAHLAYRDDYVIQCYGPEALEILNWVVFFHASIRPLVACDVVKLSSARSADAGFSHAYVSVPFFLPGPVNFVHAGEREYILNWIMPIYKDEADFIQRFGANVFEYCLKASSYDYFDARDSMNYLHVPE